MANSQSAFSKTESAAHAAYNANITASDIRICLETWLMTCERRDLSPRTIESRRNAVERLAAFAEQANPGQPIGPNEIERYLLHLKNRKAATHGRPFSPASQMHHFAALRTFFRFLAKKSLIPASPFDVIEPPVYRPDQVSPFTDSEIRSLLKATERSGHPARDKAILLFLLDTGVRASELVGMTFGDLSLKQRMGWVTGKGNKKRLVAYSVTAGTALWKYLHEFPRNADDVVFTADRGSCRGRPLTKNGLYQIIGRLCKSAGITRGHRGPHTLRHTFAIEFLRAGGNMMTLCERLGHTSLEITKIYVKFAAADIARQARQFSPADRFSD